jgi:hypothetical protein
MDALSHANRREASQLRLPMSATHSVGLMPPVDEGAIWRARLKHQQDEAAKNGGDLDDPTAASEHRTTASQQLQATGVDRGTTASRLSSVRSLDTAQQAAPIAGRGVSNRRPRSRRW